MAEKYIEIIRRELRKSIDSRKDNLARIENEIKIEYYDALHDIDSYLKIVFTDYKDDFNSVIQIIYWECDFIKSSDIRKLAERYVSAKELTSILKQAVTYTCQTCHSDYQFVITSRSDYAKLGDQKHHCSECLEKRRLDRIKKMYQKTKPRNHSNTNEESDNIEWLRSLPYQDYLNTDHWQITRYKALKRAGFRCELCNHDKGLHVHHKTYENKGDEKNSDLIVLCSTCHAKFHDKLASEG